MADSPLPAILPDRSRKQCPFYGFHSVLLPPERGEREQVVMMDQRGNQCGLIRGYTPCMMELLGEAAEWERCALHVAEPAASQTANIVEGLKVIGRVYPDEVAETDGVSFAEWFDARTAPSTTAEVTPP